MQALCRKTDALKRAFSLVKKEPVKDT